MEHVSPDSPRSAVCRNTGLVGDIIQRCGSTRGMIRCGAVNTAWRAVKKNPAVARQFVGRSSPAFLGFLVEFVLPPSLESRYTKLLYPLPSQGEESALALRPHVDPLALSGDKVLGSRDGIILTRGSALGENSHCYFTSCPCERTREYSLVAHTIPRLDQTIPQFTKNTFGHFGVVPDAGHSGMSFFVKDSAPGFFCSYAGVSFCSNESTYFHVKKFTAGSWIPHVSPPFPCHESASTVLFHRNPYSILSGTKLFMMYVVEYIVCLDLVTLAWTKIELPADLNVTVKSWYEFTVTRHRDGGLALVHYRNSQLHKWVLNLSANAAAWNHESSVDLVAMFGPRIPRQFWSNVFAREEFPLGSDAFWTITVRSASDNARFVLLTLAFDRDNLYKVDMMKRSVRDIPMPSPLALIGNIYPLSEPWPPKP